MPWLSFLFEHIAGLPEAMRTKICPGVCVEMPELTTCVIAEDPCPGLLIFRTALSTEDFRARRHCTLCNNLREVPTAHGSPLLIVISTIYQGGWVGLRDIRQFVKSFQHKVLKFSLSLSPALSIRVIVLANL